MKEEFAWSAARDVAHTLVQQKGNTLAVGKRSAQDVAQFITTLAQELLNGYRENSETAKRGDDQGSGLEAQ